MRVAVVGGTGLVGRSTVEVLLPGPGARLAPTTFETWLTAGATR